MSEENRRQVADQCRVVAKLAENIAQIYRDYAKMFDAGVAVELLGQVGERTASQMETLGDILNGMDAVSEEDTWMVPIFETAQRLWPNPQQ